MKCMGDFLAEARVEFKEIQAQGSVQAAIDLLAHGDVRVLVVRHGDRLAGTVSAREILGAMTQLGAGDPAAVSVHSIMMPHRGPVDVSDHYRQGLDRLENADQPFLLLMDGARLAGVVCAFKLAFAVYRRLQSELDTLNRYLSDLHEAGRD